MIILLHSSKTMRPLDSQDSSMASSHQPLFIENALEINRYLKTLSLDQIAKSMNVSTKLAQQVQNVINNWNDEASRQRVVIDSFLGDIYSGLQASSWTEADCQYADEHLRILSGLYGLLRPLDGISPYRLEMGYKFPDEPFDNLYKYWGGKIAKTIDNDQLIINLSSAEYSKVVTKYIDKSRIITPVFLTEDAKNKAPSFVAVHSKIARGAFANWLIKSRIKDTSSLDTFSGLGYKYNTRLSSDNGPVFICQQFGGLGLSIRLS